MCTFPSASRRMSSLDDLSNGVKWLQPSRVKSCVRDIRAGAGSEGWRTASELQPGFYEEHVQLVWAFSRRRGRGGEPKDATDDRGSTSTSSRFRFRPAAPEIYQIITWNRKRLTRFDALSAFIEPCQCLRNTDWSSFRGKQGENVGIPGCWIVG